MNKPATIAYIWIETRTKFLPDTSQSVNPRLNTVAPPSVRSITHAQSDPLQLGFYGSNSSN